MGRDKLIKEEDLNSTDDERIIEQNDQTPLPVIQKAIELQKSDESERPDTKLKNQDSQKILESPPNFSSTTNSLGGTFKHKKAKVHIIEKEEIEMQKTLKQHKIKANICSERTESNLSEITEDKKMSQSEDINDQVMSTEKIEEEISDGQNCEDGATLGQKQEDWWTGKI